jgi:hypothetical protein
MLSSTQVSSIAATKILVVKTELEVEELLSKLNSNQDQNCWFRSTTKEY